MKCQICKRKTDWDSSIGPANFLVCNSCFNKLMKHDSHNFKTVFELIFACGAIREEVKENKKV